MTLTNPQQEAVFTICLMAAFADGAKSEPEREAIQRVAEGLDGVQLKTAALHQDVLLGRTSLQQAAAVLDSSALRNLAYEMAVCVCDADDVLSEPEKQFLGELRSALGLEATAVAAVEEEAEALASTPVSIPPILPAPVEALPEPKEPPPLDKELDRSILNYSLLNGALELLPGSLATLAIIPLQMKMVHGIGKRFGYSLDRGHIREFLATIGVGLTAQVVEGFTRKLLGGFLGRVGGGRMTRRVADQVASSAMSFASTYALGQAARQYYEGGRRMSAIELKQLFGSLLGEAQSLHERYLPQIQEQAKGLNPKRLLHMIRGQ